MHVYLRNGVSAHFPKILKCILITAKLHSIINTAAQYSGSFMMRGVMTPPAVEIDWMGARIHDLIIPAWHLWLTKKGGGVVHGKSDDRYVGPSCH